MFVTDIVVAVDSSEFCNISQELLKYFTFLTEMFVMSLFFPYSNEYSSLDLFPLG